MINQVVVAINCLATGEAMRLGQAFGIVSRAVQACHGEENIHAMGIF